MNEKPLNAPEPKNLKPSIANGQRYFDEPVYVVVSNAKPLALAVNAAFCGPRPRIRAQITALSHYKRVQLRWMKPDGNGGLIPRV